MPSIKVRNGTAKGHISIVEEKVNEQLLLQKANYDAVPKIVASIFYSIPLIYFVIRLVICFYNSLYRTIIGSDIFVITFYMTYIVYVLISMAMRMVIFKYDDEKCVEDITKVLKGKKF